MLRSLGLASFTGCTAQYLAVNVIPNVRGAPGEPEKVAPASNAPLMYRMLDAFLTQASILSLAAVIGGV